MGGGRFLEKDLQNDAESCILDKEGNVDNKKIAQTLRIIEAEIKEVSDHEEGAIVGKDGGIVWRGSSDGRSVTPPVALLKNNIFTHNHPSGGCALSIADIEAIIALDGYEVRAVTQDGRFVSFKKGTGEISSEIVHDMRVAKLTNDGLKIYAEAKAIERYGWDTYRAMPKAKQNLIRVPYVEQRANTWMRENAHKYGYLFTEGKI